MPRCPNCDAHVTREYIRVHADNDGRIHSCCHCEGMKDKAHHVPPERAQQLWGSAE